MDLNRRTAGSAFPQHASRDKERLLCLVDSPSFVSPIVTRNRTDGSSVTLQEDQKNVLADVTQEDDALRFVGPSLRHDRAIPRGCAAERPGAVTWQRQLELMSFHRTLRRPTGIAQSMPGTSCVVRWKSLGGSPSRAPHRYRATVRRYHGRCLRGGRRAVCWSAPRQSLGDGTPCPALVAAMVSAAQHLHLLRATTHQLLWRTERQRPGATDS